MPLTAAERAKRHRKRTKARLEQAETHAKISTGAARATAAATKARKEPREIASEAVDELLDELRRLKRDPTVTATERARVATALTGALRLHARLTGSLEITKGMILRSPHWVEIAETIIAVVAPHPEVATAMAAALDALEGG